MDTVGSITRSFAVSHVGKCTSPASVLYGYQYGSFSLLGFPCSWLSFLHFDPVV